MPPVLGRVTVLLSIIDTSLGVNGRRLGRFNVVIRHYLKQLYTFNARTRFCFKLLRHT